jgi:hypothetical protein
LGSFWEAARAVACNNRRDLRRARNNVITSYTITCAPRATNAFFVVAPRCTLMRALTRARGTRERSRFERRGNLRHLYPPTVRAMITIAHDKSRIVKNSRKTTQNNLLSVRIPVTPFALF